MPNARFSPTSIALDQAGRRALLGTTGRSADIFDLQRGRRVFQLSMIHSAIVAWSPDERAIATALDGGEVRLWHDVPSPTVSVAHGRARQLRSRVEPIVARLARDHLDPAGAFGALQAEVALSEDERAAAFGLLGERWAEPLTVWRNGWRLARDPHRTPEEYDRVEMAQWHLQRVFILRAIRFNPGGPAGAACYRLANLPEALPRSVDQVRGMGREQLLQRALELLSWLNPDPGAEDELDVAAFRVLAHVGLLDLDSARTDSVWMESAWARASRALDDQRALVEEARAALRALEATPNTPR